MFLCEVTTKDELCLKLVCREIFFACSLPLKNINEITWF